MALVLLDRARETTIVVGTTASAILLGAAPGYQSFAGVGNANTTYYCIADQAGGLNWEVGLGTYTLATNTITRAATPLSSSNAGASVSFPAGTKDVFVVYPASKGVWLDASGNAIGLGTPASFVGTNITGTATSFTASNVTTNANLTGDITSVGNATTLTNAPVIAKVLTGYVSGAGTVAATDSILQAIQKLNGNDATNANLTGMVTSVGNATTVVTNANLTGAVTSVGNATSLGSFTSAQLLTAITGETGTGAVVFGTSPTLVTPALGTPSSGTLTNCTFPTLNQNTTGSSGSCTGNAATATALSTASGSAPSYACRAWVNFNGTGTVAIRASGNVSSITDNGVGDYTVNFTTAMPDANYCVTGTASRATLAAPRIVAGSTTVPAAGSVRIQTGDDGGTAQDCEFVNIAIFR